MARWTQIRAWCVAKWSWFWTWFRDHADAPLNRTAAVVGLLVVTVPLVGLGMNACEPSDKRNQAARSIGARMLDLKDAAFVDELDVKHNGTVAIRIEYRNTTTSVTQNVRVMVDIPPELMTYPSDVKILSSNNPGGAFVDSSSVEATDARVIASIGHFNPGASALIVFPVTLHNPALLNCGENAFLVRARFSSDSQHQDETDEVRLTYLGLRACS